jgi:hypothetical protein
VGLGFVCQGWQCPTHIQHCNVNLLFFTMNICVKYLATQPKCPRIAPNLHPQVSMSAYVCVLSAVPPPGAWSCGSIGTNLELLWGGEGVQQNCPCMRACPVVWDSFVHQ